VYRLITHETKPCTLWDLENKYSIKQAYQLLEIIEVYDARRKIAMDKSKEK
jgi:hypothetical protein